LGERSAQAERQLHVMIFCLPPPSKGEGFVSARVGEPLGFARGLGFIREQTAADSEIDSLTWQQHGGPRHS
jgi:hypothetical protein